MRRRGPGLIRAAATTAVVAGTATAVSGRVQKRQYDRWSAENEQQAMATQSYAPAAEPDYTAELERLAQLKAQGVITEQEFQSKKKAILGI
ncbi:MAG TPA: SHOCT domain-containing protein [Dehalococcoidia bacterium]|nr:SHOCT domain-containing protein [Dehalococcoidia bacterium]